jgi:hypothetical protein
MRSAFLSRFSPENPRHLFMGGMNGESFKFFLSVRFVSVKSCVPSLEVGGAAHTLADARVDDAKFRLK